MSLYYKSFASVLVPYLTGADCKLMLLGRSQSTLDLYVQDQAHEFRADVSEWEVVGDGYTEGGLAVTGFTVTSGQVGTGGQVKATFNDVEFGFLSLTPASIAAAVLYVDTGDPATDRLLGADVVPEIALEGATSFTYFVNEEGFLLYETV